MVSKQYITYYTPKCFGIDVNMVEGKIISSEICLPSTLSVFT